MNLLYIADEKSRNFADTFNYAQEAIAKEMKFGKFSFFSDAKMERSID